MGVLHESYAHERLKSSFAFRFRKLPAMAVVAATRPGLKASRSASMTVKATAHSEPRGSLCSTSFQPSAAEFCSPTPTTSRRSPP